jgi:hypothetical protein
MPGLLPYARNGRRRLRLRSPAAMAVHVGSPKPSSPPPPLPPTPRRAALPHPLGPPRRPPTPGLSPPPVLLAPRGRGCRRAQGPRPEGARRPFRPRRVPRRRRGGPPRAPPRARPARRPPCRRRRVPSTPRRGASGFSSAARWSVIPVLSLRLNIGLAKCSFSICFFFQMKLNMHFYDSLSSINRFEEFIYWRRSLVLQKLFVKVDKTATKV